MPCSSTRIQFWQRMVMVTSFVAHQNGSVPQRVNLTFYQDCFEGTFFSQFVDTESSLPLPGPMDKKEGFIEDRCCCWRSWAELLPT